jgi:hypothetical protein
VSRVVPTGCSVARVAVGGDVGESANAVPLAQSAKAIK